MCRSGRAVRLWAGLGLLKAGGQDETRSRNTLVTVGMSTSLHVGGSVLHAARTSTGAGTSTNGGIVFNYQDANNYRFVQMRQGLQRWTIGQVTNGTLVTVTQTGVMEIELGRWYELEVLLRNGELRVFVDGKYVLSYNFGAATLERVGLFVDQCAHALRRLGDDGHGAGAGYSADFSGGASGWQVVAGTWAAESGAYSGQHSTVGLSLASGRSSSNGWLRAAVQVQPAQPGQSTNGALVLDYGDANNHLYAILAEGADEWRVTRFVGGQNQVLKSVTQTLSASTWYTMEVIVRGQRVTLVANGAHKLSAGRGGARGRGRGAAGEQLARAL